jgi:hypothetical protein
VARCDTSTSQDTGPERYGTRDIESDIGNPVSLSGSSENSPGQAWARTLGTVSKLGFPLAGLIGDQFKLASVVPGDIEHLVRGRLSLPPWFRAADISLAARSFGSAVLTLDRKRGLLRDADAQNEPRFLNRNGNRTGGIPR